MQSYARQQAGLCDRTELSTCAVCFTLRAEGLSRFYLKTTFCHCGPTQRRLQDTSYNSPSQGTDSSPDTSPSTSVQPIARRVF